MSRTMLWTLAEHFFRWKSKFHQGKGFFILFNTLLGMV